MTEPIMLFETNYGYEFKRESKTELKISKSAWNQIHMVGLNKPIIDGVATIIFSKTANGIIVTKTLNDQKFIGNFSNAEWQYIKDWVRCPEKREELTAEYIKSMKPEEIKKRNIENFRAQFESEEYKKGLQEAYDKIQDYQTPPQDEKELTRAMVDSWSFEELKNKIKEDYKPQLSSSKNESAFSAAWRQSHYKVNRHKGEVIWDTVSPYAYDYQIVWDIRLGLIRDTKDDNYLKGVKIYNPNNKKEFLDSFFGEGKRPDIFDKSDVPGVIEVENDPNLPF